MHLKKDKNVTSFRKALTVPFIICILALIPDVKSTYGWLEQKCLDLLFTSYPFVCKITGCQEPIYSPTVIITKDQSFQTKFGRSPTREDFGKLLNKLKSQGVKTAAFDFIYDEAKPEEDEAFIKQLEQFPYTILAYNFIGHGKQNFSYVDYIDEENESHNSLISLYRPIADKATTRGLINIPTIIDSTVRYAPLAYRLEESQRFLPTLGFSTWIISLLEEEEENINKIDLSKCSDIKEAFETIKASSPYKLHTLGHEGVDKAVISLENIFIYKYILKHFPQIKQNNFTMANLISINSAIYGKTWVKLPEEPLPIVGYQDIPLLRLPYQKLSYPLIGDGIEKVSMTSLINTETEEKSAILFDKNRLTISHENPIQKINPQIPSQNPGNNTIYGKIINIKGEAVENAKIWAVMPKTGYWEKAVTDKEGKFKLNNLPEGDYIINAFINSLNGCDKASISITIDKQDNELPLLMLADNTNSVEIPSEIIPNSSESELWIYGEVIPMLHSNNEGKTVAKSIPNGFSIISMNDNEDVEENFSLDEKGNLLLNDHICSNGVAAVMPNDESWTIKFHRKITLTKGKDAVITDLPSSLDAIINVTNKSSLRAKQIDQELIIKPGLNSTLTKLPRAFLDFKTIINLRVSFPEGSNKESEAILLSDSGKEYEIKNGTALDIPNDDYIVLTQSGDKKGLYTEEIINKKTVFIGTALAADQDFIISPINFLDKNFYRLPGVHVHANLFTALKHNRFFYAPPFHMDRAPNTWPYYQFLLILPILIILNSQLKNARTTKSTLMIALIVIFICLTSVFLFPRRIIIPVFYPSLLIISFGITRGFVEWINSRRLATETQNAFSRFISADIVSQIVNNPDAIKPGGEKKELTVMFTDIAGFTSISEKLDADALTELMNSYLDEMTKILFKNGGTLDKYIGDAIMGFWNHPTTMEDHATRAVTCAIEMQKKLKEMRERWIAQGLPKVEMRAGINTGTCMVGFIGSKIQMNFTCLGDNVNLASRLEGANKAYGTFIMISEPVKKQLNPYLFSTRFLDFLAVKGKNEPVLVYEVRGWQNEETQVWKEKAGELYHQGIDKYLAREWDKAIESFEEVLKLVPDDAPSKVYIERCKHFKQEPPEANWDGRFILKTK